jgi:hypothetical protein
MTESLNFSLFAMILALWLLFLKNENLILLLSFIVAVSLWIFLRETNGWLALMLGGVAFIVGILRKKKYYLLVAIGVFSAFAINYLLGGVENGMNQRWIFPFLNVVSKRILNHNGRVKWFQEHGMPVSPALMQLEDTDAYGNEKAFYESSELEPFREWLVKDGRKTYILFLLTHRYYVFSRPTQDLSYLSIANNDEHIPGNFNLMPARVNNIVLLNIDLTRLMQLGMIASGIAILFLAIRRNGLWLTLVFIMALVYPHLAIVWHGDAMGLSRHSLLANMQLRLSIWMILLVMINEFLVMKEAISARLLSFRAP